MTKPVVSFDTNILFYAADRRDPAKHEVALALLERAAAAGSAVVIAGQALCELYASLTRKRILPPAEALDLVRDYEKSFERLPVAADAFSRAFDAVAAHGLQIWDAVLWANADAFGCKYLVSEDFQDRRRLGGVTFLNPFNADGRLLLDAALPPMD
ncbi:PIN domain-containing protein [Azospirillum sp. TSO35-2]|uniref:PIN domain-containing protein n=1 Tax=Azospirillum sp. TSO35-2 TaxID=716796 RepID=UPI000D60F63D|nr:PIN domain-containing protein [Azospirillum sp. TSO35-2]PWC31353.1 twitching motility protein PilT [Azospirillum sp. TSO35-2]